MHAWFMSGIRTCCVLVPYLAGMWYLDEIFWILEYRRLVFLLHPNIDDVIGVADFFEHSACIDAYVESEGMRCVKGL